MSELTLVVLAAGLGTRYGGLKQLEVVGPSGETLLDYSMFDAVRAGFRKVVFVIRRDFEAAFRRRVRAQRGVDVAYCFQEIDDVAPGFEVPPGRTKPWGTGQAVLAARRDVHTPFAVINADDFYGEDAYARMAEFLRNLSASETTRAGLVGYRLASTLSEEGGVSRGLCVVDEVGHLSSVIETHGIQRVGGVVMHPDPARSGSSIQLTGEEPVSMNLWGFTPSVFAELERRFSRFLRTAVDPGAEFYLPWAIGAAIADGALSVTLLPTSASWFGVTFPGDKPRVQAALAALIESGRYPTSLRDAAISLQEAG